VRALYIMGENPMMSEPNLNETRKHMAQLEFLVAQDLFINESGAFADVFLPATPFAEKDGTFTNTDRRVQRVRAAHPPRGTPAPTGRSSATWPGASNPGLGPSSCYRQMDVFRPRGDLRRDGLVVPDFAGVTYERIEQTGLQYPVWDKTTPAHPISSPSPSRAGGANSPRWITSRWWSRWMTSIPSS
jgi:predicted molibdopterin-dependent oxidoreductase YjgC